MKRILSWLVGGAVGVAGSYWLLRYLRPRHSALAFDGAVGLIADATSPIGQALAMALAKRGARVALAGSESDTLTMLRQVVDPYAADVITIAADLFNKAERETLVETVLAHYKSIDLLIIELDGISGGPFDVMDDDVITEATARLSGVLSLTRRVLSLMRTRGVGTIVYVMPLAGRVAIPGLGLAGAAAHGLTGFSDALRRESFGTGVQIVTAFMGLVHAAEPANPIQRWAEDVQLAIRDPSEIAEQLLDGLLNGQDEVVLGGNPHRTLVAAERYAPFLVTLYWRVFNSPRWLAAARDHKS